MRWHGRQLARTDFGGLSMKNILYDPLLSILQKNRYGIPEPVHGREVPSTDIDAVLLPLLAFDQTGNRVGYGKGFYGKRIWNYKRRYRQPSDVD